MGTALNSFDRSLPFRGLLPHRAAEVWGPRSRAALIDATLGRLRLVPYCAICGMGVSWL